MNLITIIIACITLLQIPGHAKAAKGDAHTFSRKGKVTNLEIASDEDGSQGCDTTITLQLFDDQPAMVFQDPDCVSSESRRLKPKKKDSKEAASDKKKGKEGKKKAGKKKAKKGEFHGDSIDGGSTLSLLRDDATGRVVASVNNFSTNTLYYIRPDEQGDLIATETHVNDVLPEGEAIGDLPVSRNLRRQSIVEGFPVQQERGDVSALENISEEHRALQDDDGSTIDIMVVWTEQAECEHSGKNKGCRITTTTTRNMEMLVALAIQETNEAFVASGIETELQLVHAYRHGSYVESGTRDALVDVTLGTGGLADVHAARDKYGADMVAMIVHVSDYCGIGWRAPGNADYAFSISDWSCATGGYTFGHELGHNFGCRHDRGALDECKAGGYNFGYRDPLGRFRSMLAYNCASGQCDNNRGGGCMRAKMYSTPDFLFYGYGIGTEESNCARQINNMRRTVARYRQTRVLSTPEPTSTPSASPTMLPSNQPSPSPTNAPSASPSTVPTSTPSSEPTMSPSSGPTSAPSRSPSFGPTMAPSSTPSSNPTAPTASPTTGAPTSTPSKTPTSPPEPSASPSQFPTGTPTIMPSATPSSAPSTDAPSLSPSSLPSENPTDTPSASPSMAPSTSAPTGTPSASPSSAPTTPQPSSTPSLFPTPVPTSSDCAAGTANMCGYSLDESGNVVDGFHSVCVYDQETQRYETLCMVLSAELEGMAEGDFMEVMKEVTQKKTKKNKKNKKKATTMVAVDMMIHSCGCCQAQEESSGALPEHCIAADTLDSGSSGLGDYAADPLAMADIADYKCGVDSEGKVKVKFCFYDSSKRREKSKCMDPFDLRIKDEDTFLNWGDCP